MAEAAAYKKAFASSSWRMGAMHLSIFSNLLNLQEITALAVWLGDLDSNQD
jgi:hypothetical protein